MTNKIYEVVRPEPPTCDEEFGRVYIKDAHGNRGQVILWKRKLYKGCLCGNVITEVTASGIRVLEDQVSLEHAVEMAHAILALASVYEGE